MRFELEPGKFGIRMVLRSAWADELIAPFKENDVRELELNYAKGWKVQDVAFLANLSGLMSLQLTHWNIEDISPIHALHNLQVLDVNTYCRTKIDFSQFPMLEEVGLEWRQGAESLFSSSRLRNVFINRLKAENLCVFKALTRLASLKVYNSTIRAIGNVTLPALVSLEIANARKLGSLEGIAGFPNLSHLAIEGCRAFKEIAPLASLEHLEWLCLGNDGAVESLRPIAALQNLKEVYFSIDKYRGW